MKLANGGNTAAKEQPRTLAGSTPAIRARKRKKVENLRKNWNETCLNAGIPSISISKAAMTAAMLLVHGNHDAFTHNKKLVADLMYIQKRYYIDGGEIADREFTKSLKWWVDELKIYERLYGYGYVPDMPKRYFKDMYNVDF